MNHVSRVVILFFAVLIAPLSDVDGAENSESPQRLNLYLSPIEINAGKAVAESACADCHGIQGVSTKEGVPHLAGQHVDYLFAQLKAYQAGTRVDPLMRRAVASLSDEALIQVAGYYNSLDLPNNTGLRRDEKQGHAENGAGSPYTSPVEAGRAAAAGCGACHGVTGNGAIPGMPRLTGKHPEYLAEAIKAYRDGRRKAPVMQLAVKALSDDDIENIALFYALQTPEGSVGVSTGDAVAGKADAVACSGCHGETGNSPQADIPGLAGQDPQYFARAIAAYTSGERDHAMMQSIAVSLSESSITNLSAFFATQVPAAPDVREPLTTEQWAEKCDRCHGVNGNSIDPDIPSLSGQRADYLVKALMAYQSGVRVNSMMHAMSGPLRAIEAGNLAAYYSGKQRKAVIFIRVPCN